MSSPYSLHLAPAARQDLKEALLTSRRNFGKEAQQRYRGLFERAISLVLANPYRPGVRRFDDPKAQWCFFHFRMARQRDAHGGFDVKRPRHFLVYRIVGDTVEVARVLHDSMDIPARLDDVA